MARILPFVGLCLVSFGVTHLILTTRSVASPKARTPLVQAAAIDVAPKAETRDGACRPVRIVYPGPIGPAGGCTVPR